MKRGLWLLPLCLLLMGQDYNVPFRPRAAGGGSSCTSPTDYIELASHAYFSQDSSMAVDGDPDDECDSGGRTCTAVDLETSVGLTNAGSDILVGGTPDGTDAGGVRVDLDLVGTEDATTVSQLFRASDHQDASLAMWINLDALPVADGDFASGDDGGSNRYFFYIGDGGDADATEDNLCIFNQDEAANLCTTADVPTTTWAHVAVTINDNGSEGGTDVRTVYINAANSATDNGPASYFAGGGHTEGLRDDNNASDLTYQAHEVLYFQGTVLSAAQLQELVCCGADPTNGADKSTRDTSYGAGIDCSGE